MTSAVLKAALGDYGHTRELKTGALTSPRLVFEFVEVKPIDRAFRRMIRDLEFDLSEMAIATFLQARAFDKPLVLLPVVLMNRLHHGSILRNINSAIKTPADLTGRRVGVRAYSQTTGVWVRGILHSEYGVDLNTITWVTLEGSHVAEYQDPPNVERAPAGKTLEGMLLAGEIDACVVGRNGVPNAPEIQPLIADAEGEGMRWLGRVKALPVNHMLVLRQEIVDAKPWIVDEVLSLFQAAKEADFAKLQTEDAQDPEASFKLTMLRHGIDPLPFGVDALRRSLEMMIDFAVAQRIIPRRFDVDELFSR